MALADIRHEVILALAQTHDAQHEAEALLAYGQDPEKAVIESLAMADKAIEINKTQPLAYGNAGWALTVAASLRPRPDCSTVRIAGSAVICSGSIGNSAPGASVVRVLETNSGNSTGWRMSRSNVRSVRTTSCPSSVPAGSRETARIAPPPAAVATSSTLWR